MPTGEVSGIRADYDRLISELVDAAAGSTPPIAEMVSLGRLLPDEQLYEKVSDAIGSARHSSGGLRAALPSLAWVMLGFEAETWRRRFDEQYFGDHPPTVRIHVGRRTAFPDGLRGIAAMQPTPTRLQLTLDDLGAAGWLRFDASLNADRRKGTDVGPGGQLDPAMLADLVKSAGWQPGAVEAPRLVPMRPPATLRRWLEHVSCDYLKSLYVARHPNGDLAEDTNGWPEVADLQLLAVGTTSLVLRADERVIKLRKLRFFDREDLDALTHAYAATVARLPKDERDPITPIVFSSGKKYVVMEPAHSATLREYLATKEERAGGDAATLERARRVGVALCRQLQKCGEMAHGDISLDNIAVDSAADDLRLQLLDFGPNFMLTDPTLGAVGTHEDKVAATAPKLLRELRQGQGPRSSVERDVYSVGVLLVRLLLGSEFRPTEVADGTALDRLYRRFPGIGPLAEDLLDPADERRLLNVSEEERTGPQMYVELERRLAGHVRASELHPTVTQEFTDVVRAFDLRLDRSVARVFEVVAGLRDTESVARLRTWDLVNRAAYAVVVVLALVALWQIGTNRIWPKAEALMTSSWAALSSLQPPRVVIDLGDRDLAEAGGLLVLVSFAMVARRYYGRIFAGIDLHRSEPQWDIREWPRGIMRLNSWVFILPAAATYFLSPAAWGIFGGLGAAFPALNTWSSFKLCNRAEKLMRKEGLRVTPEMLKVQHRLHGWAVINSGYAFSLIVIGLLLLMGLARDALFYALFIALVVNGWRAWGVNCGDEAEETRRGLVRFVAGYRRAVGDPSAWQG